MSIYNNSKDTIILSLESFIQVVVRSEIPHKFKILKFIKTINGVEYIRLSSTTTSVEQLLDIYSTRKLIIQHDGFETQDIDSLINELSSLNKKQIIYSLKNEEFFGTVLFFIKEGELFKCVGTVGF